MASNSVFLSPGVYTSEKDLTFVQRQVGVTTLGLVGETTKGPAFQPIFITNYDEFKTFFGGLNPEKFKGNGIPKYELPYIAKSYLSQANQAFVTRVLGLSGYDAKLAWGITMDAALDTTTSGTTAGGTSYAPLFTFTASTAGTITTISSSSSLLQTIFNTGALNSQLNFLSNAATGTTATITPTFIKGSETAALFSGIGFTLYVNSSTTVGTSVTGSTTGVTTHYSGTSYTDVENKLVALLRSRGVYDGAEELNVELSASTQLNISQSASTVQTSPLATFKLTGTSNTQGAFEYSVSMDSTSKNYIARVLGETSQDAKPAAYVEEIFQNMFDTYVADGKVRGINMTLIDYSDKLYCDNNYKDNLLRHHHRMKFKFPTYHMIRHEGPPHKRIYVMGVENPNLSNSNRNKYFEEKNYKKLCISFGHGLSKKEGEQSAAKMSLILHNVLNTDQYIASDLYYPDFNTITNIVSDETDSDYGI